MTKHDIEHYVATAKQVYQLKLVQADRMLRALVAQDPANLDDAKTIQASYSEGILHTELAALEQPEGAAPEAVQETPVFVNSAGDKVEPQAEAVDQGAGPTETYRISKDDAGEPKP